MEKLFTVDEANRTLPLVKRIVEDLVRDHHLWEEKVRQFELATVGSSPEHPDVIAELLQIEAQRLASDIEHYIAELNDLGVICKGMDTGLVDFRGEDDNDHLHAKVVVADRLRAIVGSANLTAHGLLLAHELAVLLEGPAADDIAARIDLLARSNLAKSAS